jgi:hypothetical protein
MAEPAHRRGVATRAPAPALLKGPIFGPNGRAMSPSHTRRRGRIYRYYVTREAIANGYDSCAGVSRSRSAISPSSTRALRDRVTLDLITLSARFLTYERHQLGEMSQSRTAITSRVVRRC